MGVFDRDPKTEAMAGRLVQPVVVSDPSAGFSDKFSREDHRHQLDAESLAIAAGNSNKNFVHNGKFEISQKTLPITSTAGTYNTQSHDRWKNNHNTILGTVTMNNSVASLPVDDFTSCLLITPGVAEAHPGAPYWKSVMQGVEGVAAGHLKWGTDKAKDCVLSFWVRTNVAGTYSGALRDSAATLSHPFSFACAADTWEKKTVFIKGPTTGSFPTGEVLAFTLWITLTVGTTFQGVANNLWQTGNLIGSTDSSNTWGSSTSHEFRLTGVQLEQGVVATPYEHKPYHQVQMDCFRYYEETGIILNTSGNPSAYWKVKKRAAPALALTIQAGAGGTVAIFNAGFGDRMGFYQNTANSIASNALVVGSSEIG